MPPSRRRTLAPATEATPAVVEAWADAGRCRAAAAAAEPEMIEVWRPGRAAGAARGRIAGIASAAGISGAATAAESRYARGRRREGGEPRCPGGRRWSAGATIAGAPTRLQPHRAARPAGTPFAPSGGATRMTASSDSTRSAPGPRPAARPNAAPARAATTGVPNAGGEGARSEFAVRQARRAQGAARGRCQGAPLAHEPERRRPFFR